MNRVDIMRASEIAKLKHRRKRSVKHHCALVVAKSTAAFLILYMLAHAIGPYIP